MSRCVYIETMRPRTNPRAGKFRGQRKIDDDALLANRVALSLASAREGANSRIRQSVWKGSACSEGTNRERSPIAIEDGGNQMALSASIQRFADRCRGN